MHRSGIGRHEDRSPPHEGEKFEQGVRRGTDLRPACSRRDFPRHFLLSRPPGHDDPAVLLRFEPTRQGSEARCRPALGCPSYARTWVQDHQTPRGRPGARARQCSFDGPLRLIQWREAPFPVTALDTEWPEERGEFLDPVRSVGRRDDVLVGDPVIGFPVVPSCEADPSRRSGRDRVQSTLEIPLHIEAHVVGPRAELLPVGTNLPKERRPSRRSRQHLPPSFPREDVDVVDHGMADQKVPRPILDRKTDRCPRTCPAKKG